MTVTVSNTWFRKYAVIPVLSIVYLKHFSVVATNGRCSLFNNNHSVCLFKCQCYIEDCHCILQLLRRSSSHMMPTCRSSQNFMLQCLNQSPMTVVRLRPTWRSTLSHICLLWSFLYLLLKLLVLAIVGDKIPDYVSPGSDPE